MNLTSNMIAKIPKERSNTLLSVNTYFFKNIMNLQVLEELILQG